MLVRLTNVTYGTSELRETASDFVDKALRGPARTIRVMYEVPAQPADVECLLGSQIDSMARHGSAICRQLPHYELCKDAHLQHNKLSHPASGDELGADENVFVIEYTVAKPIVTVRTKSDAEDYVDIEGAGDSDDSNCS